MAAQGMLLPQKGKGYRFNRALTFGSKTTTESYMKFIRNLFVLMFTSFFALATANAQEHGTKDDAKGMVNAALVRIKQVGTTAAFSEFATDKSTWNRKDLYVVVQDLKGVVLVHGANEKLVGKNLIDFKDQNGKLFVQELIGVGSKGEGWVDYDFTNPITKKVEGKSSFVKRIPAFDGVVLVGAYR
jgi:signal transduction histidine kinase